jgi:hypothetical protein
MWEQFGDEDYEFGKTYSHLPKQVIGYVYSLTDRLMPNAIGLSTKKGDTIGSDIPGKRETRREYLAERIFRTLVGLLDGLEHTLPMAIRQTRHGIIEIDNNEEVLKGKWRGSDTIVADALDKHTGAVDIKSCLVNSGHHYGELAKDTRTALADMIIADLRVGTAYIPGFNKVEYNQNGVQLTWERSEVKLGFCKVRLQLTRNSSRASLFLWL